MSKITLEIESQSADSLRVPPAERESRLRQELAVRLYERQLLPFGKARELCGQIKWAFHALLAEQGIIRQYDVEELHEDVKALGN